MLEGRLNVIQHRMLNIEIYTFIQQKVLVKHHLTWDANVLILLTQEILFGFAVSGMNYLSVSGSRAPC